MRMSAHIRLAAVLFLTTMVFDIKAEDFKPLNCGDEKELYEARGVIQTPNFPRAFAVPIRCRWVIDASNFTSAGDEVEIYVYLTQLFVRTGFNVTEYKLYDREAKTGYLGTNLMRMPSSSDEEYQFVRTNLTYLVIDFELDMLEGNHLRVLHGLMDVFGFNITYEISNSGKRIDTCSVTECSLVGHCYAGANFSSYKCSCFEGFYGENCGYGPLCGPQKNSCENGSFCRHAGETMVVCSTPVSNSPADITDFSHAIQCNNENLRSSRIPCDCENPERVLQNNDRLRYIVTVKVADTSGVVPSENVNNTSALRPKSGSEHSLEVRIQKEIEKQLKKYKLTKYEILQMINITLEPSFTIFVYHFFANKSEENKVHAALELIKTKKIIPNIIYRNETYFFRLMTINTNAIRNTVYEGNELTISCVCRGSPWMTFQWYKDGVLINASIASTRNISVDTKINNGYQYVNVLTIKDALLYDSGTYTCQIRDWHQRQCKSTKVDVVQSSRFSVEPMHKTVRKGENLTVLCLSKRGWEDDRLGYTWVRNGKLLKIDAPHLYYEDLYKGGSILYMTDIQKPETVTCNSVSARIDVLDAADTDIPFCDHDGIWEITVAGAEAVRKCPEKYSDNVARRYCSVTDVRTAVWQLPDFSECISNSLISIFDNFFKVTLGYTNDSATAADTLSAIWLSLTSNTDSKILPGEGEPIVYFLSTVCEFLLKNKRWMDFHDSSEHFFDIIDLLLQHPTSIINKKAIFKLSSLITKWSKQWAYLYHTNNSHNNVSVNFNKFKVLELFISQSHEKMMRLHRDVSVKMNNLEINSSMTSSKPTIVVYRNLSRYLLPEYTSNQYENDELLYQRTSPIVQVILPEIVEHRSKRRVNSSNNWLEVDVEFQLPILKRLAAVRWHICCGLVFSFGQSWSLNACKKISVATPTLTCSCNQAGLLAMFVTELPKVDYGMSEKYQFVAIIGCALCFLQCIVSLCVLLFRWLKMRSTLGYLKLQVCISTATSMILFLYGSCDPSQDIYPYLLSGLQMFLVTSITSHVSILIVMYIDIISLKKIPEIDRSAIAVMTFCPMILVIVSPLSRKINNEKVTCWWLCKGTLMFYINVIVGLIFFLLFVFLYTCLMRKLFFLWNAAKVEKNFLMQRISFLHYTTFIFFTTVFMAISSMFYVNINTSTSQCVFGSSCAFLGFIIFISYVPKNEVLFCLKIVFPTLRRNEPKYSPDLGINRIDIEGNKRTESDNESLRSQRSETYGDDIVLNVYRSTDPNHLLSESKTRKKKSVAFPDDLIADEYGGIEVAETSNDNLSETKTQTSSSYHESNVAWPVPQHNAYISTTGCLDETSSLRQSHPEMLTTRVCVELGVMKNPANAGNDSLSGKNGSTVVICSVDVEPCPGHIVELNEVKFTANAIGSLDTASKLNELPSPSETTRESVVALEAKTPDVLDRISQDLDYLLNRSPSPTRSRDHNAKLVANNSSPKGTNIIKPKS